MGNFLFTDRAWGDYLYWQSQDKKTLKRINQLLQDIDRNGHEWSGKPEALRNELSGWWSRRIDSCHRLVCRIESNKIIIAQCRTHYEM